MLMPGSSGSRPVRGDDLISAILQAQREEGGMHVLTWDETQAQELTGSLTKSLGETVVGFMGRGDERIPSTPVVVSGAATVCFAYVRARMAGSRARDALERTLANTTAVCVDIPQQEHMTPCEIRNPKEGLLGALRIGPYLMCYGRVVELMTGR